ncbi:ACP S-malonyltransferase [Cohnella panacarvi]|uniref:ACP S-malonyltransferase n=1 Tax=Cohnella panacarvi TaxID=400776 RepID=UPI00047EA6BF|nr:ACP S-malonyltransferase [Cohnella panacarvi]
MAKIGWLFPGQGSQYPGMGKSLTDRYAVARLMFEEASDALGWDVLKLCAEGPSSELTDTRNAQPAILTCGVAAFRAWSEEGGLSPSAGAGHSLGEFTALASSGTIALADAVKLVRSRGELMQEAARERPGGMAAISGLPDERLETLLRQASVEHSEVVLAGINSRNQRVVSGDREALRRLEDLLSGQSVRLTPLNVSGAFHSPCMEAAASRFRGHLEACVFRESEWPVISNVTGVPHDEDPANRIRLLVSQLTEPVRWLACMETMVSLGMTHLIEAGPGRVLSRMWESFESAVGVRSLDDGLDSAVRFVTGDNDRRLGQRSDYSAFLPRCLAIAVATRNRCTDETAYRAGVIEPYRKVEKLVRQMKESGRQPTDDELRQGLEMLCSVFATKGTDQEERSYRLDRLVGETGVSDRLTIDKDSLMSKGAVAE